MQFKRYGKSAFLKGIGRELLVKFFARFDRPLAEARIALPAGSLPDDEYYRQLAQIMLAPDGLPGELNEVLYALEEMSNERSEDELRRGAVEMGLGLKLKDDSTVGEFALQIWLECPDLLAMKHNEQRVARLSSFTHYPSKVPPTNRAEFTPPTNEQIRKLCAQLDLWFAQNNRGKGASRIDVHYLNGKRWFVVRHGDVFQRVPVVQKEKTEILHFRPEKDDVVVFDEELDELCVHAGTKGEKALYCEKFGLLLRQDASYFRPVKTYSLEPLRNQGEDALAVDDVPGLKKIVLREIEFEVPGRFKAAGSRRSADIFAEAKFRRETLIPSEGELLRASLDLYFDGCAKPRKVEITAGNQIKLGRRCDADLVDRWLMKRGFRVNGVEAQDLLPLAA